MDGGPLSLNEAFSSVFSAVGEKGGGDGGSAKNEDFPRREGL